MATDWYAVRCVFRHVALEAYEERITLWKAGSFDEAISLAEQEAVEYCADAPEVEGVPLFQAYALYDTPGHGSEVFSLMRTSDMPGHEYVERFFDTGAERTADS